MAFKPNVAFVGRLANALSDGTFDGHAFIGGETCVAYFEGQAVSRKKAITRLELGEADKKSRRIT